MGRVDNAKFITYAFSVIQILTIAGFIMKRQTGAVYAAMITYIAYLAFMCLEIRKKIFIESYLLWMVVITIIGHFALGEYTRLYYTLAHFDKALHLFGSFSFALFTYSILTKTIQFSCNSKYYTFLLTALLGVSIGTVFEILEFAADAIFKMQNQSGLIDTNLDLVFDAIGAVIAGFFCVYRNREERTRVRW